MSSSLCPIRPFSSLGPYSSQPLPRRNKPPTVRLLGPSLTPRQCFTPGLPGESDTESPSPSAPPPTRPTCFVLLPEATGRRWAARWDRAGRTACSSQPRPGPTTHPGAPRCRPRPHLPRSPGGGADSCGGPSPWARPLAAQPRPRPGEGRRSGRHRPARLPAQPPGPRCPGGARVASGAGPSATPATQAGGLRGLRAAPAPTPDHTHLPRGAYRAPTRSDGRSSRPARTRNLPAAARAAGRAQTTRRAQSSLLVLSLARTHARALSPLEGGVARPPGLRADPGTTSGFSASPCIPCTAVLGRHFTFEPGSG